MKKGHTSPEGDKICYLLGDIANILNFNVHTMVESYVLRAIYLQMRYTSCFLINKWELANASVYIFVYLANIKL